LDTRCGLFELAFLHIERYNAMPLYRVGLRRLIALPFYGYCVDEYRTILILRVFECLNYLVEIMAVYRPHISVAEGFKKHCRGREEALRSFFGFI
jgi:hypothetical protein